jgi:hypothetical protein
MDERGEDLNGTVCEDGESVGTQRVDFTERRCAIDGRKADQLLDRAVSATKRLDAVALRISEEAVRLGGVFDCAPSASVDLLSFRVH